MPKVSIIVPVYNTEKYLHRCINSILAQTFTDFELLLIDDGSKDNSGLICDEYVAKDFRVKVHHIINSGANNARIKGVYEAQGKYVMFIDSDDTISIDYIYSFYNQISNTFADIVVKNPYGIEKIVQKEEYINDMLNMKSSFTMIDKIYTHKLLKENSIFLPRYITMGEDIMQSVIIALRCSSVKYFQNENILYNVNLENQLSVCHTFNNTYDYEKKYYSVFDKFIYSLENKIIKESYIKSKINGLALVILKGNKVKYNDSYFISCKNEYNKLKLKSPEALIIFYIRNKYISRLFIQIKRFIALKLQKININ